MEQDVVFRIQFETAAVDVGRADQRDFAIDRQRLGVKKAASIFADRDTRLQQVLIIAAAGGGDDPGIVRRGKTMVVATPRRALARRAAWIGSSARNRGS